MYGAFNFVVALLITGVERLPKRCCCFLIIGSAMILKGAKASPMAEP